MASMSGSDVAQSAPNGIILFWYHASPYGRRVKRYLTLRQIAHAECIQPTILPRPDMMALGVSYRRSPVMAIGRDVYVDTRRIIAKLEEMFPSSNEHPSLSSSQTVGVAALLQKLATENMFRVAVQNIPQSFPLLQDPKFQKDRADFFGPGWKFSSGDRQEAVTQMRHFFDIAESLFADGRKWVAATENLSLADLEGIWVFDWFLSELQPSKMLFGEKAFPAVHDWRMRFHKALEAAKARAPKTVSLQGPDAVRLVFKADFSDRNPIVDGMDPSRLREGTLVEVFPTDGGGFGHEDRGCLVGLTKDEVAIAVPTTSGREIRIHAPRWQFRVRELKGTRL